MHSWGNTCSERLNRAWGEPKTRERFSLGKDFFSSWLLRSSSKAKLRAERKEGRKEGRNVAWPLLTTMICQKNNISDRIIFI